eukprot:TRINITY_DN28402_c0_g1_i3.p1 TRINITY_DN28402_c0_g1~~TRINITY_DN28402_c0_g1_i3.p1  ORF type:complete len:606 (+),score=174.85 TRINITY_DN28402_c0_g1_i3:74-1891(+)
MESEPPLIAERYCELAEAGYRIVKTLGKGAYGTVSMCQGAHGPVAVKTVRKAHGKHGARLAEMIRREVALLRMVQEHPCVLRFDDLLEEEGCFHLVLELVGGEELLQRVAAGGGDAQGWSEADARRLLCDVAAALDHVHQRCVAHRDVKPANLMFATPASDAPLKLIDFGAAVHIDPARPAPKDMVGTLRYMAPEVLRQEPYSVAVDCWSLGCIAHLLLTGEEAFPQTASTDLREAIARAAVDWDHERWKHVSPEGQGLCASLISTDPRRRPTAGGVLQCDWVRTVAARPRSNSLPQVRKRASKTLQSRRLRAAVREVIRSNRRAAAGSQSPPPAGFGSPRFHGGDSTTGRGLDADATAGRGADLQPAPAEPPEGIDASPAFAAVVLVAEEFARRGEKLKSVFARIDSNSDGGIDAEELLAGLRDNGVHIDRAGAHALVEEFDRNGDGRLQYHEFVRMLSGCTQRAQESVPRTDSGMSGPGSTLRGPTSTLTSSSPSSFRTAMAPQSGISAQQAPAEPHSPQSFHSPQSPVSPAGGGGEDAALQLFAATACKHWQRARPAFDAVGDHGGALPLAAAEQLVARFAPGQSALGVSAFTRLFSAASAG